MRHAIVFLLVSALYGQNANPVFSRLEPSLGWRVSVNSGNYASLSDAVAEAVKLGVSSVDIHSKHLAPDASPQQVESARKLLDERNVEAADYRVAGPAASDERVFDVAAKLGAKAVVAAPAGDLAEWDRVSNSRGIRLLLDTGAAGMLDPERALAAVSKLGKNAGIWADPEAWQKAGTLPLAAIYMLRGRIAGGTLSAGTVSEEFVKEAYRLDIKPLIWTLPANSQKMAATLEALVSYHQSYASRTQGVRRLGGITAEERQKVEAALPASAPAVAKKPRKLLVFDLNVGRFGHPSIPYSNLAMQLMGKKTGAFEATVSSDPAILSRLKEFDAVYLNNTIGDIFSTAEVKNQFAAFISNGGGLIGNHATTVTATDWPQFGEILGGRGASHRMTDEKVLIRVEDQSNPLTKVFANKPFEYADEIFRFQPPYSRDLVRVLLSVDSQKTDMNQGRCFGTCYRDDNDYPVAWIRQYGEGRVFYTTLGHNAYVFWDAKMLQFFLAGIQYALGDLEADATPRPVADDFDTALTELARYEWGNDQAPVRRLERAMDMLGPSPADARRAEQKLIGFLQGKAALGGKEAACRQLAVIGTRAAVPVLGGMLASKDTADMARYALERIDAPDSAAALRAALSKAEPRIQAGIIHSLARRRDGAAVGPLAKLADSKDASISLAAVNALGMIGTADAEKALLASKMTPPVADALLNIADQSPGPRAMSIYAKLSAITELEEARAAAVRGMARKSGQEAVPTLVGLLKDSNADVQTAAISQLASLDARRLAQAVPQLQPGPKIQALHALASRKEPGTLPLLLEAAKSDVAAVRIGAIRGIVLMGGAEQLPLLVDTASKASGDEQAAARFALSRLPGVDQAIAAAIPSAQKAQKIELIRAAGERGITDAGAALLEAAKSTDRAVRQPALRALRDVGTGSMTPALLDLMLKSGEDDRKESEQALSAAVRRTSQPDVKSFAEAFSRTTDAELKASLAGVIATTGTADALAWLRQTLAGSDADAKREAVKGLSNWATPEPADDLLRIAKTSADPALQALALRGYIRLVQLPAGKTPDELARLLGTAMSAATRPDEKKIILASLQRIVSPDALSVARTALSDPAVAAEAKAAVTRIEGALKPRTN